MVGSATTASNSFRPRTHVAGYWRRRRERPWLAALLLASMLCCMMFAWQARAVSLLPQPAKEAAASSQALTPAALADRLATPEARPALVDELRAQASGTKPGASQAANAAKASAQPAEPGLRERVADNVQRFLTGLASDMGQGADDMRALASGRSLRMDGDTASNALLPLALAAIATIIAFILLRAIAMRIYARIDRWVAAQGRATEATPRRGAPTSLRALYRRMGAIVGALAIDVGVVVLAALAGAAAALWRTPGRGTLDTLALVFLQAFVAVEIVKVLIRTVFAVRHPSLRLLPMSDELARYWNTWLVRIAMAAGYGTLLVDPVITASLSPALGRLANLVIMLAVYVYAVRVIWQNRQSVRERLDRRAAGATTFMGSRLRVLSRVWHVLGIVYFTILLVVSQVDPTNALPFMARATAQTLLVLAVGSLLILLLNTVLSKPIKLPEDLRRRLPLLEARVNAYVPAILKLVGLIIRIVLLLLVLDAWHAFDLSRWLASDAGAAAIKMVVNIGIVLLIAALAWTVIASIIEHRLSQSEGRGMPSARTNPAGAVSQRRADRHCDHDGHGAAVADRHRRGAADRRRRRGRPGHRLRRAEARPGHHYRHLHPARKRHERERRGAGRGRVRHGREDDDTLGGHPHAGRRLSPGAVFVGRRGGQPHARLLLPPREYTIAHRESVDDAIAHLRAAFAELMTDSVLGPEILEEMTVAGVTAVNEKGVTIRILIKTTPGMQWAVQRGYNRLLKKHFDAAGIELPYPHTVVYFGQDKRGYAPPANVFVQPERPNEGGNARAAGHTRRRLKPEAPGEDSAEVLGNELEAREDPDATRA